MAYPDELLAFAQDIASLHPDQAHQPSLRRAISTAYYALFHLLIADAVANCADAQFRATLARVFDHGPMKQASEKKVSEINGLFDPRPPEEPERTIAEAFKSWAIIREEAAARDYPVSMLPSRERKQQEKQNPNKPRPTLTDVPK